MCFRKKLTDIEVFFRFGNRCQMNVLDTIDEVFIWKPKALFVFTTQIEEALAPMPETTPTIQ
jgi:hypothetical protein